MVTLTAGSVVLVPFPFSDLSHSKLRPAVVLAYADSRAVVLTDEVVSVIQRNI